MTYRGHIKNGVAVLDQPVRLPEGTPVRIEIEEHSAHFWTARTLEELAREQEVQPLASLDDLAGEWPSEDSVDEFLEFIREARR